MIDDVEIPPVLENFEVMDREWVVRQFEDEDEDANENEFLQSPDCPV